MIIKKKYSILTPYLIPNSRNIKFDYDVVQPFKRKAFETLSEMFDDVFSFLEEEYGDVATVRRQKVSVGIKFPQEENDRNPICIDVVPGAHSSFQRNNVDLS